MESSHENNPWIAIVLWTFLGLVGGLVRSCEELKPYPLRRMLSSLFSSMFAGMVTGMIFQEYVSPMMLYGMVAMGGYMGQLALIVFIKLTKKRLHIEDKEGK